MVWDVTTGKLCRQHLAMAKALQVDIPELMLLTFDERLRAAAEGEGLAPASMAGRQ